MHRLDEFADETGVFGLNLLRQRVSKVEKIFWLIFTAVFAVATVQDLRDIINIYARGETVTSVSLNSSEPITFDPTPTIFLSIKDTFVEQKNASNTSLMEILESTFSKTIQPQTLPELLFHINIRLFSYISFGIERLALDSIKFEIREGIAPDLLLAYNFYRDNNISLLYLQKVTGVMLCEKIGYTLILHEGENITNLCKPEFVTEMLGTSMSLILSSDPITLRDPVDYFVIKINRADLRHIDTIHIDLYAISTFWNEEGDNIEIDFANFKDQEHVNIRIEPILEFKKAKRATHDCNIEPEIYCEARCAANKFFDCANCWPLSANFQIRTWNQTSICPGENLLTLFSKLQRCIQTRATNEPILKECKQRCKQQLPPCKVRIFTYTKDIVLYPSINDEAFWILCYIPLFSFPVFEERIALSWQTFLAQFGGALGLYLGASFASLVHIPLFLIRVFASKYAKAQSASATKQNEEIELRFGTLKGEISEISSRFAAMEERMAELVQIVKLNKIKRTTVYF